MTVGVPVRDSTIMRKLRAALSAKTRHGNIQVMPEQLWRACFSIKPSAEFIKNFAGPCQYLPEPVYVFRIITTVLSKLLKRGSYRISLISHIIRMRNYFYMDVQLIKNGKYLFIKISHA